MAGINVPIPAPITHYTFGGWKGSGFGDINQHGPDAFKFYTNTKTVTKLNLLAFRCNPGFVEFGSAIGDRRNSVADGVPADAYIKRACTDERNIGD
jgi:Aldehyde dehydrogenase family